MPRRPGFHACVWLQAGLVRVQHWQRMQLRVLSIRPGLPLLGLCWSPALTLWSSRQLPVWLVASCPSSSLYMLQAGLSELIGNVSLYNKNKLTKPNKQQQQLQLSPSTRQVARWGRHCAWNPRLCCTQVLQGICCMHGILTFAGWPQMLRDLLCIPQVS